MNKITKGYAFLTDDFLQAMQNDNDVRIVKAVFLQMPAWKQTGMHITAEELGIDASVVDPNMLLPAVFEQYWQNLNAHARRYHANIEQGYKIEDFAEQSFWKCMFKLTGSYDSSIAVADSTNVLTNAANYGGNAYVEVLISADTTMLAKHYDFANRKPAYLQAVQTLPVSYMPTVLGGSSKALYDTTYYDIAIDECKILSERDTTSNAVISFNAVLLMYANDDILQAAGMYFPNPFEQTADGYEMPMITKHANESYGISLNFVMAGMSYIQTFTADNASNIQAMQNYSSVYEQMLALTGNIAALVKANNVLTARVTQLEQLVTQGKYANIEQQLTDLQNKLTTKFAGTVSSNKLLELFLAAKNNAGQLSLNMSLSDLSDAILDKDIIVTTPIGDVYQQGDVISAGTMLSDILRNMLNNNIAPEYILPFINMLVNGQEKIILDYGYQSVIDLQKTLNINDAGGFSSVIVQEVVSGQAVATIDMPDSTLQYTLSRPLYAKTTIRLTASYTDGPIKNYPDGTPCYAGAIYAGTTAAEALVLPKYTVYLMSLADIDQLLPTIPTDTATAILTTDLASTYTNVNPVQVVMLPKNAEQICIDDIAKQVDIQMAGYDYVAYAVASNRINFNLSLIQ